MCAETPLASADDYQPLAGSAEWGEILFSRSPQLAAKLNKEEGKKKSSRGVVSWPQTHNPGTMTADHTAVVVPTKLQPGKGLIN